MDVDGPGRWSAPGPGLALGGPAHIRDVPSSDSFKKLSKTHFLAWLSTFTNIHR